MSTNKTTLVEGGGNDDALKLELDLAEDKKGKGSAKTCCIPGTTHEELHQKSPPQGVRHW